MSHAMREEPGVSPKPSGLKGFEDDFPETVYLLHAPEAERHCLIRTKTKKAAGLACFSTREFALDVSFTLSREYQIVPVSFDEAHDIARDKGEEWNALILADNPRRLKIHFVR